MRIKSRTSIVFLLSLSSLFLLSCEEIESDTSSSQSSSNQATQNEIAKLTVSNVSIAEGDNGTSILIFNLALDQYYDVATINYSTEDVSALISDNDYVSKSGTVTFNGGATNATIEIIINGDTTIESNETFKLNLNGASNLETDVTFVTATITNDDIKKVPLNDTGTTFAGEYPGGVKAAQDCATSTISGKQDCHIGRDDSSNDNSDGYSGFNFTKLDNAGSHLNDQTLTNHSCVKDNVTTLIWEVKTSSGLHDKNIFYRWGGKSSQLTEVFGTEYKEWDALIDSSNDGTGLCGFKDWRVPTHGELFSLVNFVTYSPSIDANYFPNTMGAGYWTSSPDPYSRSYAWIIDFSSGFKTSVFRSKSFHVRLVRGGK